MRVHVYGLIGSVVKLAEVLLREDFATCKCGVCLTSGRLRMQSKGELNEFEPRSFRILSCE